MPHLDIVADILQRVVERGISLLPTTLMEIETEVRADWGGERLYIEKVGEAGRAAMARRDKEIRDLSAKGVQNDYLSLRYNLSMKRIRQITAGQ